jgi:hypothetical protein
MKFARVHLLAGITMASCTLGLSLHLFAAVAQAASPPLEFTFTAPSKTVLNSDGGPWNPVNLANRTVKSLTAIKVAVPIPGGSYSVGPLRLVHAPMCLNPVQAEFSTCGGPNDPPPPLTASDVTKIDGYLQKAEDAKLKIILRFAYNDVSGGMDAPMSQILNDIRMLAPIVAKHKNIIYAMDAGLIGYWGEGHNSNCGTNCTNNTKENTGKFMAAEEAAFGPYVTLLCRYPSNILDWEPRGKVIWGMHDDDYGGDATDSHTWMVPNWSRFEYSFNTLQHLGQGRTDEKPFSVEPSGSGSVLATYEDFDAYSRRFHLNAMALNIGLETLAQTGRLPDVVNHVGPVIGLTHASIDVPPARGLPSSVTLSFVNNGYSKLLVKVPVYLVMTDALGKRLDDKIFPPVLLPIDLTSIDGSGGTKSVTTQIKFPMDVSSNTPYFVALWMPDPDSSLRNDPKFNYFLNNVGVPKLATGLNQLFQVRFSR